MIRAVLDTNVIVSSFLQPTGLPAQVRRAWQANQFVICLSKALFTEIGEVLARPVIRQTVKVSWEEVERFLQLLAETSVWCAEPLAVEKVVSNDPDDDVILATAVGAEADAVVTGDQDLLGLKEHRGIAILSPRQFLEALRETRE